jgi:hypothetical protein
MQTCVKRCKKPHFTRLELYNNQSSVQSTRPPLDRSAIQAYDSKNRLQSKLLLTDWLARFLEVTRHPCSVHIRERNTGAVCDCTLHCSLAHTEAQRNSPVIEAQGSVSYRIHSPPSPFCVLFGISGTTLTRSELLHQSLVHSCIIAGVLETCNKLSRPPAEQDRS